jgi:hypothetical protein
MLYLCWGLALCQMLQLCILLLSLGLFPSKLPTVCQNKIFPILQPTVQVLCLHLTKNACDKTQNDWHAFSDPVTLPMHLQLLWIPRKYPIDEIGEMSKMRAAYMVPASSWMSVQFNGRTFGDIAQRVCEEWFWSSSFSLWTMVRTERDSIESWHTIRFFFQTLERYLHKIVT